MSKPSDKLPYLELSKKLSRIGIEGCILELISDYLDQRKQIFHVEITSSQILFVKSGVAQGSAVGPLMFCIFMNDLLAASKFSDSHLLADDLKILCKKNNWLKVQADLDAADNWATDNKRYLAMDKCLKETFRGDDSKFSTFCSQFDKIHKGPDSLRE